MIPTIKISREEAIARGCPAVGSHVEVAVEAWDAFDRKYPLRKRMVLEQAGATEREAVHAWTRAFRAESDVLGGRTPAGSAQAGEPRGAACAGVVGDMSAIHEC